MFDHEQLNINAGINLLKLQYNNLKHLVYSNLGENLCYKPRGDQEQDQTGPHFRKTLRELYLKDQKGSKNFRRIFGYNSNVTIDYGESAWKRLLGKEVCKGELMNGF